MFCQTVELDIKYIYAAMLKGDFDENYEEVEVLTLGQTLKRLKKLDYSDNDHFFTEEDYKLLEEITEKRNHIVHKTYQDLEEGEFVLTLLASMAQEEARDMSENVKWAILKKFSQGKVYSMTVLGYRIKDGVLAQIISKFLLAYDKVMTNKDEIVKSLEGV